MSITIYGCVAFPAGTITFENLETCLEQSACIIFEGVHAGQIALTLSGATNNEDCNDTFYGCMNWTTGKFQVEIPTDCCEEYGYDCNKCSAGQTPKCVTLEFTDVVFCNGCYLYSGNYFCSWEFLNLQLNGKHILKQVSSGYPCTWERHYSHQAIVPQGLRENVWYGSACSSFISSYDFDLILTVWIFPSVPDQTMIWARLYDPHQNGNFMWLFRQNNIVKTNCITVAPVNNKIIECGRDLSESAITGVCQNGTAQVLEGEFIPPEWLVNRPYSSDAGDRVIGTDDNFYGCKLNHTSTYDDKPITGANWSTYWFIIPKCL